MRLKAKTKFQSKAGSFNPGDAFKTDRAHGEYLVSQGFAEEVAKEKEDKQVSKAKLNGHK